MKTFFLVVSTFFIALSVKGQCDAVVAGPLSPRIANYDIDLTLDHTAKKITAREYITWINTSPDTLDHIRMYMYINAFKNTESTFLTEAGGTVFGQDLSSRGAETWGWIEVDKISQKNGTFLEPASTSYIQPDDDNKQDQTVLNVPLPESVLPGDTLKIQLDFTAKMPKIIARTGYSRDDYFMFTHWFPQMGVYEKNPEGVWGWNCHQFHRSTEFYSDFGTYDVRMTVADNMVVGASGCQISETPNGDGTTTHHYRAEDVIDFAWTAYPHFKEYTETWQGVTIRLLSPAEHSAHVPRFFTSVKYSLEYFQKYLETYPYTTLTVVDPPLHGLRSGFMEYPTFITTGSFYGMPKGLRTLESLAVHEFSHQYFMGMLASNEKEEAWLDEGFVTYFEDRIMDNYYGNKSGLFDLFGYRTGNKQKSRLEYTGLPNPKVAIIGLPGWEIQERDAFKGLIYAKSATMLCTLEGLVGFETMNEIMKTYFQRWKFAHPRGRDFFQVANEVVSKRHGKEFGESLDWFFQSTIYGTEVCDYAVTKLSHTQKFSPQGLYGTSGERMTYKNAESEEKYVSTVTLSRLGELIFPQEVVFNFEDGSQKIEKWSGKERLKIFSFTGESRIVSAHIDPEYKIFLDINLNNNSKTLTPDKMPLRKYTAKVIFWAQTFFQTIGFMV